MSIDWRHYDASHFWDELVTENGGARPGTAPLLDALARFSAEELRERRTAAELAIRSMGITFTVYDGQATRGPRMALRHRAAADPEGRVG